MARELESHWREPAEYRPKEENAAASSEKSAVCSTRHTNSHDTEQWEWVTLGEISFRHLENVSNGEAPEAGVGLERL